MRYSFTLPVTPVAKQSFRAVAVKKGVVTGFTSDKVTKNRKDIQKLITAMIPKPYSKMMTYARINKLHFIFEAPGRMKRELQLLSELHEPYLPKTTKPDLDNLVKQVLDSIKGLLVEDDNIICEFRNVGKFYGAGNYIILEIEGD